MEFRARIEVPGLPAEDQARWQPLIDRLIYRHGELGPTLSWEGSSVIVVLSTDAVDRNTAARELFGVVSDSLIHIGLSDTYPVSVEIASVGTHLMPA